MILYTPAKAATEVPIVDLATRRTGAQARRASAYEIHKAARETGFFYITNHGVDRALVDAVFREAARLLDQPIERKERVQKRPGHRGWEGLEAQLLDPGSPPDYKESWNCARDYGPPNPKTQANQWPDLPGFREVMDAYYDALEELQLDVMRLLALSLELPEEYFDAWLAEPSSSLRLLRYPPQPATLKPNQLGAGAHTDFGAITFLAQDDVGGLEVRNGDGEWIKAPPIADTFVVNLGDLFPRWTNDAYRSSLHRVVNNHSGRNRYSIVFFSSVNYAAPVDIVPTCLPEDGIRHYPPTTAGEHSTYMLARSRAHTADPEA